MYLIFDTETTGLPKNWRAPISDTENWPRCVQLAWQVHDELGNLIESKSYIVKPDDYDIPFESEKKWVRKCPFCDFMLILLISR